MHFKSLFESNSASFGKNPKFKEFFSHSSKIWHCCTPSAVMGHKSETNHVDNCKVDVLQKRGSVSIHFMSKSTSKQASLCRSPRLENALQPSHLWLDHIIQSLDMRLRNYHARITLHFIACAKPVFNFAKYKLWFVYKGATLCQTDLLELSTMVKCQPFFINILELRVVSFTLL